MADVGVWLIVNAVLPLSMRLNGVWDLNCCPWAEWFEWGASHALSVPPPGLAPNGEVLGPPRVVAVRDSREISLNAVLLVSDRMRLC